MKKIISTVAIALLVVGTGFAQNDTGSEKLGHKEANMKREHKGDAIMKLESLSDAQRAELQKLRKQNQEVSKPQREKIRAVKEALRTQQASDSPNIDEVNRLIDEKNQLEAQLEKNRAAQQTKMKSVLTDEQKAELNANMKARKESHQKHKAERKAIKQME